MLVLLFIPNIIWAIRHGSKTNKCTDKLMNVIEQIGRYGCMFLVVFSIGLVEFGFASLVGFIVYITGNIVLLLAYWVFWFIFLKAEALSCADPRHTANAYILALRRYAPTLDARRFCCVVRSGACLCDDVQRKG